MTGADRSAGKNDNPGRISTDAVVVALGYLTSFGYPLVALPFLARAIGAEALGLLIVTQAVLQIVVHICDYGFSVSALRRVAVRSRDEELSKIIASTLTAKAVLLGGSAVVVLTVVAAVPGLRPLFGLFVVGLVLVAIGTAFPSWLLQGLGRFTEFSLVLAASRLLALIGLLLTVSGPEDLPWALAWQFLPLALAAVIGWGLLARTGHLRWQRPTRASVRFAFADGGHLFVGHIALMSMGAVNSVILGALAGPVQTAYFAIAERLSNAGRGIMGGVQDAMLPRMSHAVGNPHAASVRRTITAGILGGYLFGGIGLILFAPMLLPWYLGPGYEAAVPLGQIAGLTLCVAGGSALFNLRAAAAHRFRAIAAVTSATAVIHLLALIPASALFGAWGAAFTVLGSEALLCLTFSIDASRHRRRQAAEESEVHSTDAKGESWSATRPSQSSRQR